MNISRRDFLSISALAAITALGGALPTVEKRNDMPYRELGKTGERVSLLCVGGYHIGVDALSDADSIRLIRTAVDQGVNFLDNAWTYHDGVSETRMGKALKDGYREKVFLMSKHYDPLRTAEATRKQLEESLRRLDVEMVDLWQVHQIQETGDPALVYANGVMDVMLKAREEGKVRYIGFTGHTRPEFLREMIERGFAWDTVQMPLNPYDRHWVSFQEGVLPMAREKEIGVLAMKTLGGTPGQIPNNSKSLTARESMHYAMNLPISSLVSGMDSMERLEENLAIAKSFEPLDDAQLADILAKCETAAQDGKFEPYKDKTI